MGEMMNGVDALVQKISDLCQAGYRIITVDCVSQEDLELIADACIASKKKILAVDPGVFTATLARKIIKPRMERRSNHILVVVGSVNSSTTAQLEEFWLTQEVNNVMVKTKELLEGQERREAEIGRVVEAVLKESGNYTVSSVVGDGIYPENRIDFLPYMKRYSCTMEDISEMITGALAEITVRLLRRDSRFHGLYASGGDVTQGGVCLALHDVDLVDVGPRPQGLGDRVAALDDAVGRGVLPVLAGRTGIRSSFFHNTPILAQGANGKFYRILIHCPL
jgi:uncharacterized protein YgbK (DUF1537 family)